MREIRSTQGYVALVDDEDYERFGKHRWYAHNGSNGGKRPARREPKPSRKVVFLVHAIMGVPEKGWVVDHIDGNPWNNQKSNLRVCTNAQNLKNQRRPRKDDGAGKGVHRRGRRWIALICSDGVRHDLGSYETALEAELVYDAAALFLHGDFACLNHPNAETKPRSPLEIRDAWQPQPAKHDHEALAMFGAGMNGANVARRLGISVSAACSIAIKHGIPLTRGRPRLEAKASAA